MKGRNLAGLLELHRPRDQASIFRLFNCLEPTFEYPLESWPMYTAPMMVQSREPGVLVLRQIDPTTGFGDEFVHAPGALYRDMNSALERAEV